MEHSRSLALTLLAMLCFAASPPSTLAAEPVPRTEADPAWTSLYNGSLDDFRIYLRGRGYLADAATQEVFVAEPGQIHVRKGTSGLLVTRKRYRDYHVRVQYRWGEPGGSMNAGLMSHVDLESTVVNDNRPRSVEINMRHDVPGSLWMASKLGPFGYSFVAPGTRNYLPQEEGGVRVEVSPFGERTVLARYRNGALPTRPVGEWNSMEAIVRGSESLVILVNSQEVVRLFDLRRPAPEGPKPGEPLAEGGIGLQSEGQEIFYRHFELRPLEPGP